MAKHPRLHDTHAVKSKWTNDQNVDIARALLSQKTWSDHCMAESCLFCATIQLPMHYCSTHVDYLGPACRISGACPVMTYLNSDDMITYEVVW